MYIDKQIIENALNFYEIDNQEYINKCYECIENINNNSNLQTEIDEIYNILYIDKTNKISELWTLKNINELFKNMCHPFITNILLLLGYNTHLNNMKKYGLDEKQSIIHKKRVKECLTKDIYERKYEGIRISQMLWGSYFVNVKLIEIDRLQYGYCKYSPITKQEELCIKIHIPSGKKLEIKEVKVSLNKSKELISKYFKLDNPKYYCESWLLSNQVRNMLDNNSNIAKFYNMFDIIEGEECIDDILNFVYNVKECYNYKDLVENTSLQRKIKQFLIEGEKINLGIGILK